DQVSGVALSADAKHVVTGSYDKRVWEVVATLGTHHGGRVGTYAPCYLLFWADRRGKAWGHFDREERGFEKRFTPIVDHAVAGRFVDPLLVRRAFGIDAAEARRVRNATS